MQENDYLCKFPNAAKLASDDRVLILKEMSGGVGNIGGDKSSSTFKHPKAYQQGFTFHWNHMVQATFARMLSLPDKVKELAKWAKDVSTRKINKINSNDERTDMDNENAEQKKKEEENTPDDTSLAMS